MAEMTREQVAALADAICSTAIMNMTLRDFFAAFALMAVLGLDLENATHESDAAYAYAAADAMMVRRAAREK